MVNKPLKAFSSVNPFRGEVLGLFVPLGCVVQHHMRLPMFLDISKKFQRGLSYNNIFSGTSTQQRDALLDWLTGCHEEFHFYHTLATPIGRFMLKFILQRLGRALLDLRRLFKLCESKVGFRFPMPLTYAVDNGFEWPSSEASAKAKEIVLLWRVLRIIEDVLFFDGIRDAEASAHFLDQFIEKDISGLNSIYFSSHNASYFTIYGSKDQPSCPDPRITTIRLIEMYAYINTIRVLQNIGAPNALIQDFTQMLAGDLYTSPMIYAEEKIPGCSPDDLQVAVDLALASPLGIANIRNSPTKMSWEEIHPGWRYSRIIDAISRTGKLGQSYQSYDELADILLEKAGLVPWTVCRDAVMKEKWRFKPEMAPKTVLINKGKNLQQMFEYLFAASDAFFLVKYFYPDLFINLGINIMNSQLHDINGVKWTEFAPLVRVGGGKLTVIQYGKQSSTTQQLEKFQADISIELVILMNIWELMECRTFQDSLRFLLMHANGNSDEKYVKKNHDLFLQLSFGHSSEYFFDIGKLVSDCSAPKSLGFWLD